MTLTRRSLGLAAAGLLAAPRIARAAADPILIGVTVPITGPAAEAGRFMMNGINLALEDVNKEGVLGRPMEIATEDDQTTNPGRRARLLAARRRGPRSRRFIGSIRSTQVNAMAPDVLKVGKPMMFGGTDPTLTHMGNKLAVPLPAERQLLGQGHRRVRREGRWASRNGRSSTRTDAFGIERRQGAGGRAEGARRRRPC